MNLMKPRQEDYHDLMDSYVHKDDLATVNGQEIDARINTYNTSLRSETPGAVDTLGDILKIFQGFPDDWNLKAKLDAAGGQQISWTNVNDKPTNLAVSWAEQRLYLLDKFTAPTGIPTNQATIKSIKTLFQTAASPILPSSAKTVVVDLELQPVMVNWSGTNTPIMVVSVVGATIAITPKITSLS